MAKPPAQIQQECPFTGCHVILTYDILIAAFDGVNDDGVVTHTLEAQTTPLSTAHVWTHQPEEDTQ